MGYISQEVEEQARSLGVDLRVLPSDEMEKLRNSVYSQFTSANPTFHKPLWELMEDYESLHDPNGWELLGDLLGHQDVVLFFEASSDPIGLSFPDGYSLQKVIGECTGFVFYVTDLKSTYLLCFNDHDVLLASGAVSKRLRQILDE